MIPLTFRQLEVFVRVVEAGSFRACADQLSISQASVGEHIRVLEQQLNCVLFERRRGSAAVLTYMGEQVFRRAQTILAATTDLLSAFDPAPRDRMRRRIRIGAHGFVAESLSKRLSAFIAQHPAVDIELERRSFAETVAGLAQNQIEVGYFLARGPVPELESFVAWQEPMAFFTGARHRLAQLDKVQPEDLANVPFAYLPTRTHLRGEIDTILRELGISGCPAGITSDDHLLILENLGVGASFACMFTEWLMPHVERGQLARLNFTKTIPSIQVRYAVRGGYRNDRIVDDLLVALNCRE